MQNIKNSINNDYENQDSNLRNSIQENVNKIPYNTNNNNNNNRFIPHPNDTQAPLLVSTDNSNQQFKKIQIDLKKLKIIERTMPLNNFKNQEN